MMHLPESPPTPARVAGLCLAALACAAALVCASGTLGLMLGMLVRCYLLARGH